MGNTLRLDQAVEALVVLFAAKPPPAPPPQPTMLGTIVVIVALFVAVIVGWWNWREAHEEITPDAPEDLLASFEEAHAAGEIDDEEIKRLRAKLSSATLPPSKKPSEGGGVTD